MDRQKVAFRFALMIEMVFASNNDTPVNESCCSGNCNFVIVDKCNSECVLLRLDRLTIGI